MLELMKQIDGKVLEIRKDITYYYEKYDVTVTTYFGKILLYRCFKEEENCIQKYYEVDPNRNILDQFYLFAAGIL